MLDFEYKYFSDEEKMFELIQKGPVVSWFDVHKPTFQGEVNKFRFLAGGVYYQPEACDSYEEEIIQNVAPECVGKNGQGYTCLKDCKNKRPKHCDR